MFAFPSLIFIEKRGRLKCYLFSCYYVLVELQRLGSDALHLHEVFRAPERAVLLPVLYNPFGILRPDVLEERDLLHRGLIDIDLFGLFARPYGRDTGDEKSYKET